MLIFPFLHTNITIQMRPRGDYGSHSFIEAAKTGPVIVTTDSADVVDPEGSCLWLYSWQLGNCVFCCMFIDTCSSAVTTMSC